MAKKQKIHATLGVIATSIPCDDPAWRCEVDESIKALDELFGTKTDKSAVNYDRPAHDWGYTPAGQSWQNKTPFQSGDLVRVFKTVIDGDVAWSGKIRFNDPDSEYPKGVNAKDWRMLFENSMPAKLELKNGQTVYGALYDYLEQGSEGPAWCVSAYGKTGWDGLHLLADGDRLTVYSRVRKGAVEWEGRFASGPEQLEKIDDAVAVARETRHVTSKQWLEWSRQRRPAVIVPR